MGNGNFLSHFDQSDAVHLEKHLMRCNVDLSKFTPEEIFKTHCDFDSDYFTFAKDSDVIWHIRGMKERGWTPQEALRLHMEHFNEECAEAAKEHLKKHNISHSDPDIATYFTYEKKWQPILCDECTHCNKAVLAFLRNLPDE